MKPREPISKAAAARRWNLDRAMVTRYQQRGMPALPDGKLDWPVVDQWRKDNIIPERSGSFYARTQSLTSAKQIVDAIHGRGVGVLVEIGRGLNLTPLQIHTAFVALTAWVFATLGDFTIDALYPGLNGPQVDYTALQPVKLSKAESDELDRIVDRITAILADRKATDV